MPGMTPAAGVAPSTIGSSDAKERPLGNSEMHSFRRVERTPRANDLPSTRTTESSPCLPRHHGRPREGGGIRCG
jgi:hypothetical protein